MQLLYMLVSNGAIISLAIIMSFEGIPSGPLLFAGLSCLIGLSLFDTSVIIIGFK